ncbi:MAG: YCF48-related protein [Candidatus Binatia bacterium]
MTDVLRTEARRFKCCTSLAIALVGAAALAGCHRSEAWTMPVRDIEPRDAFYDIARTPDGAVVIAGRYGKLLRSTDFGAHWQPISTGMQEPLFSVAFAERGRGVAVGAHGLLLESTDGGETWARRDSGTERDLLRVRFTAPRTGYILGEFGTLLRSTDGGATWNPLELRWDEVLPELTEALGTVEPHLYDVASWGGFRAVLVGEYGLVLATEDGGLTWERRHGGGVFDPHLFAVACTRSATVLVTGQGGQIFVTTDRGTSWREQRATGSDIYALIPIEARSMVLAVGDLATVLRSEWPGDSGTWHSVVTADYGAGPGWFARGLWINSRLLVVGRAGVQRYTVGDVTPPEGQQIAERQSKGIPVRAEMSRRSSTTARSSGMPVTARSASL